MLVDILSCSSVHTKTSGTTRRRWQPRHYTVLLTFISILFRLELYIYIYILQSIEEVLYHCVAIKDLSFATCLFSFIVVVTAELEGRLK